MKLSSKGRYAVASMVEMAQTRASKGRITVPSLSQRLNISKLFLDQVFSVLRRGGLVSSTKGSQGGFQLAQPPETITLYDILILTETGLFEPVETTVDATAPGIEKAMQLLLFTPLEDAILSTLKQIRLSDLSDEAKRQDTSDGYMYYL